MEWNLIVTLVLEKILELLTVFDHALERDRRLRGCLQALCLWIPFLKRKGVLRGQQTMLQGYDPQRIRLVALGQFVESGQKGLSQVLCEVASQRHVVGILVLVCLRFLVLLLLPFRRLLHQKW